MGDLSDIIVLIELKIDNGMDPLRTSIDLEVPDSYLRNLNPETVIELSMNYGFIISECCNCPEPKKLRANNKWITPTSNIINLRKEHEKGFKISHGYCPECYTQFNKDIQDYKSKMH